MNAFLLDFLVQNIGILGNYNKNDQCPPACVLWPDKDRQWEPLLPALRERLPLLTLGPYDLQKRSGPAYWIRCMLAGTLAGEALPPEATPVIYLPGISRQEIRAVEECPPALQPLAELQYRGVLWTQKNGRDWTVAAFLQSKDDGLGIELGADPATREALLRALLRLADEPLAHLRQAAPLRAPFFDALLNPDEIRRLLLWLNDPASYPKRISSQEWQAFCNLCRQKYGFHPEKDGPLTAAGLLGARKGAWAMVWERYLEAPVSYPNLPEWLRKARPTQLSLFEGKNDAWPQDNEEAEKQLRQALNLLANLDAVQARSEIVLLETQHGPRRKWVWKQLNLAPLAGALEHLDSLAHSTQAPLVGGKLEEIRNAYAQEGWKADAAVLRALRSVEKAEDVAAVKKAVRALYKPWLEQAAMAFQTAAALEGFGTPAAAPHPPAGITAGKGGCILFSDALRMDAGWELAGLLERRGFDCAVSTRLTALPPITPTAKPAVSPVVATLTGQNAPGLTPFVSGSGAALTQERFRKLLGEAGYQVLGEDDLGNPQGRAWTELGATDAYGHQHGWKLAHHLAGELQRITQRVAALLEHGWEQVLVVTDHGWLFLPDGLPVDELPKDALPLHLTEQRKGRCARLKPLAHTDQQTVPWAWDPQVRIAVPAGISCYESGKEYEHGGLSPQECIIPLITVTRPQSATAPVVSIQKVSWKGLRCTVELGGDSFGSLYVDLRSKAADNTSSMATLKVVDEKGLVSLLVEDDELLGQAAILVIVNIDGLVYCQQLTKVGGE